ncbi:type VII toxin-antitoxin system HepT family RNase toxin [Macromonas bipunctata]|uniref:type VII toxin-antitoxin system HepT family RNase toxin n=1 Tax=Macromonas bipunctata TaxID=183670 RepID=UPI000C32B257|nr:DUF86 domain-containing protein [Macromonas bipunctata]
MQLELYQQETARIAADNRALLRSAVEILQQRALTPLEEGGVLHALQVLIENAIGKSKQWLKHCQAPVPVSAYDAFRSLALLGKIRHEDLSVWNAVVGLRNRIVHDYMNIDMQQVLGLVTSQKFEFIVNFLLEPILKK